MRSTEKKKTQNLRNKHLSEETDYNFEWQRNISLNVSSCKESVLFKFVVLFQEQISTNEDAIKASVWFNTTLFY